jgi:hypothetical protein
MSPLRFSWFSILAVLGSWSATSTAQEPLFTFVQVSDSQPETAAHNQAFVDVLRTIAEAGQPGKLLPRPVDLVLFAGDITFGNTRSEWVAAKQKLDSWLTANDIPAPVRDRRQRRGGPRVPHLRFLDRVIRDLDE